MKRKNVYEKLTPVQRDAIALAETGDFSQLERMMLAMDKTLEKLLQAKGKAEANWREGMIRHYLAVHDYLIRTYKTIANHHQYKRGVNNAIAKLQKAKSGNSGKSGSVAPTKRKK